MSHPINWLFVWAVLLVIGFGWMVIHEGVNNQPAGNT